MRRLLATLLLGAAPLGAAQAAADEANEVAGAGATVVVVGDSISAGYGFQPEQGWVNLLRRRLGPSARVVNASISGDTTSGGLARIDRTLAVHEPDIVILELGGNDALRGYPIASIRANLLAMTEAVIDSGAKPLLAGMRIPPNYGPRYTEAFHAVFREVAGATGAALVPFLVEGVATDETLMQGDGIHPSADAQVYLLDNVWPLLEPLLEAVARGR